VTRDEDQASYRLIIQMCVDIIFQLSSEHDVVTALTLSCFSKECK
jgi:hypothetical protein